jgi:hypothetical protein
VVIDLGEERHRALDPGDGLGPFRVRVLVVGHLTEICLGLFLGGFEVHLFHLVDGQAAGLAGDIVFDDVGARPAVPEPNAEPRQRLIPDNPVRLVRRRREGADVGLAKLHDFREFFLFRHAERRPRFWDGCGMVRRDIPCHTGHQ